MLGSSSSDGGPASTSVAWRGVPIDVLPIEQYDFLCWWHCRQPFLGVILAGPASGEKLGEWSGALSQTAEWPKRRGAPHSCPLQPITLPTHSHTFARSLTLNVLSLPPTHSLTHSVVPPSMLSLKSFSDPTQGTPSELLPALKHMNADHQPSLRALVQNHLSLPRPPQNAQLTTLDARGFEVEYEMMESFWGAKRRSGVRIPWNAKGEEGEVRVQGGGKEVRERMVRLTKEAEAGRNKRVSDEANDGEASLSVCFVTLEWTI